MAKNGNLSINSENIFPIIKKWLYSDHDIFFRELVSNGCDAITKLKKLEMMGEAEIGDDEEFKIQVLANPDDKTLTFIDNGIGMTEDEVDEYINQIAFSGAEAFLEKYKDKTSEDQIIGHFGLGFYSAFMVADRVTIETKSYKEDAKAVLWDCEDGTEYTMSESDKKERGTIITLYLNEDSVEFSNLYRAQEVLEKYCSFMPVEIYLSNPNAEPEYDTIPEDEVTEKDTVIEHIVEPAKTEEKENENGEKVIKQIPLLRYYNVFHISQVDGVEPKEQLKISELEPIEEAEKIKTEYMNRERLKIFEKVTNKAFYTPTFDYIEVPCKEQYQNIEEFYSTLFHEMIHSTGHKNRLDRLETGASAHFGSETYSKEELVAELGSATLVNMLGIETEKSFKNSSGYIQDWLQVLKNDNKFIVSASSKAEKAVKYILNEQ